MTFTMASVKPGAFQELPRDINKKITAWMTQQFKSIISSDFNEIVATVLMGLFLIT